MTIDDKIRNENVQFGINRQVAKISELSSGKIDEDEFLIGKEILRSDQSRKIKQAKFTYSPLGEAFEKEIKKIKK